jgi:hypothetical protein
MRIAVYLSGHMRTFGGHIKNSLTNLMEGYDYDLYVSTYYKKGCDNVTFTQEDLRQLISPLPLKNIHIRKDETFVTCLNCNTKQAEYGPIKHISFKTGMLTDKVPAAAYCEDCKGVEDIKTEGSSYWGMWSNVNKCYLMAKEEEEKSGFLYDYHIRSRPDVFYLEKIDFNNLPPLVSNLYAGFGVSLGYPDDTFAIGKGEAWDHYCDLNKVLLHSLGPHELTDFTFRRYPFIKLIQIGIVRDVDVTTPQFFANVREISPSRFCIFYTKHLYIRDQNML